jgi:hypothetical protein
MNLKHLLEKIVKTAYIDEEGLKSAPSKIKGKFELFTVGKYISDDDLQKDYESEVPMYQTAEQVINLLNSNKNATIEDMYFILFVLPSTACSSTLIFLLHNSDAF